MKRHSMKETFSPPVIDRCALAAPTMFPAPQSSGRHPIPEPALPDGTTTVQILTGATGAQQAVLPKK